jgi:hypothetical protein
MNCQEYVDRFLPAHVDDELIGRERRAADQHVRACGLCCERFAADRQIKALVRSRGLGPMARAPADVQLRIRAAIGAATGALNAERITAFGRLYYRALLRAGGVARRILSSRGGIPASVAALGSLGLIAILLMGRSPDPIAVPATPAFDLAIQRFDTLAQDFVPNVPSESAGNSQGSYYAWVMDRGGGEQLGGEASDLARSYREVGIPEEVYAFEPAGYGLYGGRVDESSDGRPMAYTAYRGEKGELLSICWHAADMAAPVGARYWAGAHTFYEYKGHSLCLTFHPTGHYISILVAHEPVTDLLRDVAIADGAATL